MVFNFQNMDGTAPSVAVNLTQGLTATYFSSVTVNTTGTAVVTANTSRKVGVWIKNDTATVFALVGDALGTAVFNVGTGVATNMAPVFIPGTGAIYVKASSGFVNVSGVWA